MKRARFRPFSSEAKSLALEAQRDVVVHAFSDKWRLKCAFVSRTIQSAVTRHNLLDNDLGIGRVIAASLLAVDCKGEERVSVHMIGGAQECFAESMPAVGEVRAYARLTAESTGPAITRLSRVAYGATEASSSTVAGHDAEKLLQAQGLACRLFSGGGIVMEQSAALPLALEHQLALQDRVSAFGDPEPGELASEYVRRLASGDAIKISRVWTAFHCRCVLPTNARSFAQPGDVLVCQFCAREHHVPHN